MRILFVWSGADWSIFDVARGYRNALAYQGHEIRDFRLYNRLQMVWHGLKAFDPNVAANIDLVSRIACEPLISEAAYHKADLCIIISGVAFHPNAIWVLRQWEKKIPIALLVTESPYEDDDQKDLADLCDITFTNERTSAQRFGWHYLRHAYDPAIHHPLDVKFKRDVFIIGTGWDERVKMMEAVDWTGIDLAIHGSWPIEEGSLLDRYYHDGVIRNEEVAKMYPTARICLNQHRQTAVIRGGNRQVALLPAIPPQSLNPRAFEIAACGAFQISDYRQELEDVFGDSVPVYHDAQELGDICRFYLAHEGAREKLTEEQHNKVAGETFEHRAVEMMDLIRDELHFKVLA